MTILTIFKFLLLGIVVLMLALSGMALFWLGEFEQALFYYMR